MPRALVHIGLALALVVAPTLCCCQAAWLAKPGQAAHASVPSDPPASCCQKVKPSCCHEPAEPPSKPQEPQRHAPECACCADRQPAAPHEGEVAQSAPRPTGELLSLALAGLLGSPDRAGAVRGWHPPDGTGVDAKFAKLFERHVLRC